MPLNLVRNFPENEVRHEYVPSKMETNDPADKDKRPIPPVRQRPHQLLRSAYEKYLWFLIIFF